MRRWPPLALALILTMGVASASVAAQEALRFERTSIVEHHELWRAVTGQLVHSDLRLFAVDVPCVAVLAWLVEQRRGGLAAAAVVLASAVASGAGTAWLRPDIEWLEGASGIASGLLAFLLADVAANGRGHQRGIAVIGAAAFGGKLLMELAAPGGMSWWADPSGEVEVVGVAHACGALLGLLAWAGPIGNGGATAASARSSRTR